MRIKDLRDKGFWLVFIIYCMAFLGDFITTFSVDKGLRGVLESNPLFLIFPSFIPIILLNGLVIYLFIVYYKKGSPVSRYWIIASMVFIILLRITAMQNAVYWINNPISVQEAVEIYTVEVKQEFMRGMVVRTYAPLFINLLIFHLWKWDHAVKKKWGAKE